MNFIELLDKRMFKNVYFWKEWKTNKNLLLIRENNSIFENNEQRSLGKNKVYLCKNHKLNVFSPFFLFLFLFLLKRVLDDKGKQFGGKNSF